ncbi:MAG: tetratricopeptide repeat protein [Elusimicrobiota bacterium]|nr:tetratricopeptide repeat protein [Elusimicrobiota bacterium]
MLRNYYVIGKFTPFVASSGINIYIGNNQDAEGSNIPPSFIKRFAPQTMEDEFVREASNRVGRNLTIGEANKYWLKQSLEFVKNNSKKYVSLFVKKILLLLYPIEITSNIWLDTKLSRFPFYNFIFPLGVCGMIISLKQWKKYLLLYLFIATYLISAILFFVISEYRFPIIPIIIVFTSFMIFWFYENIVEHNYSKAAIFILLVLMLFVIQRMTIKRLDIGNLSYVEHYNKAYIYVKEKMFDKAIIEYKLSLKDKPDYWDAWEGLGMVYLIVGMYDESTESFKKAIEIQPENAESVYYLKKANEMEKLRMGIRTLPLRPAKK